MTELPKKSKNPPFDKPTLLGIAPQLRALQEEKPVTRVRTAAGEEVWLVTRYDEVKALLAGGQLGRSHPDPERAAKAKLSTLLAAVDYDDEQANHAHMRALLVPRFSARRTRTLTPRIEHFVDDLLGRLAAITPPADLHSTLSSPLPVMVICELLGVPFSDWERFRELSAGVTDLGDNQNSVKSTQQLIAYMAEPNPGRRMDLRPLLRQRTATPSSPTRMDAHLQSPPSPLSPRR